MAWSLAETTELLQTANYLSSILDELLPVAMVPTTIFILSAATAFATGTSWGTMGIFYPNFGSTSLANSLHQRGR
ncbi:MAG: hypothetical protein Ct9H300mP4_08760 [Gammaproteobacteria bacterium]|nr:MAG: hypothetical protein Ct9H300mP4_08760 [Gammaproteobacteria bacterium]